MSRKSGKHRQKGKVVTAGHCKMVEGLEDFLPTLETWPEVKEIRVGAIRVGSRVGRGHNSVKPIPHKPRGIGLGGGFGFRVNDWVRVGQMITGVRCTASYGRAFQEVILTSDDLSALRDRLVEEGYVEEED